MTAIRIVPVGLLREPLAMAPPSRLELACIVEAGLGILPDHFVQSEASTRTRRVCHDERLVDEPTQHVDDVVHVAQMVRGIEVEPAGEHGEAPEGDLFVVGQQLVTPVERRRERLLTVEVAATGRRRAPRGRHRGGRRAPPPTGS